MNFSLLTTISEIFTKIKNSYWAPLKYRDLKNGTVQVIMFRINYVALKKRNIFLTRDFFKLQRKRDFGKKKVQIWVFGKYSYWAHEETLLTRKPIQLDKKHTSTNFFVDYIKTFFARKVFLLDQPEERYWWKSKNEEKKPRGSTKLSISRKRYLLGKNVLNKICSPYKDQQVLMTKFFFKLHRKRDFG